MDTMQTPDPQRDLVTEIALQLRLYGVHEIVIDDCTDQRLVDVRWAVLRAGRMLGARPSIQLLTRGGQSPTSLTVIITGGDPAGPDSSRTRVGLDALLQAVMDEPAPTRAPLRLVPRPTRRRRAPAVHAG